MVGKNIRQGLGRISKETGVPVKKILDLLFILKDGQAIDNNKLVRKVGLSRNVLNQIKKELASILEPVSKNTKLDVNQAKQVQALFEAGYRPEEAFWGFFEEEGAYQELVSFLKNIDKKRPLPKRKYDQFRATIETTARRVCLLDFFGDIQNKRLLFIGDNDFVSVAAGKIGGAENITVVDIDRRILTEINSFSKAKSLGIKTIYYDTRRRLPVGLEKRFDVVFADPPYTPKGIKLFVSRAIASLDEANKAARIYLCYGNSDKAKERFLPIYKILTNSGLMIRWVFDKFNRYWEAESIGSTSSLFVAETTPKTKSLIKGNYDQSIYTNSLYQ
jgi:N4-bis(aminopropyl)spermidine synthase